ncbi:hypothetical protein BCO71033_04712 [Burkholderia contaminans]|uniref:Uncharacterized protein n=1 Tax=Burkholderia contaminans TaxID=488447 RepID=A0A6P3A6Y7_9BURK|nr:hypothetical protein BCO71033_04712 [Burkholderia contaminans]
MHGPRPRAGEDREGAREDLRQIGRVEQRVRERGESREHVALGRQLVQAPVAAAEFAPCVDARDHQHRDRIRVGLCHRGRDIGHPRPGDDEADARPARDACIAVGHEAGPLFVARRHVADRRCGETAIELDGMHAGNAEHAFDAVAFEEVDERFAAGAGAGVAGRCRGLAGPGDGGNGGGMVHGSWCVDWEGEWPEPQTRGHDADCRRRSGVPTID